MIIKSNQYIERKTSFIDIYDQSVKGITLEYFTIINKIMNHYTKDCNESKKEKKSTILNTESNSTLIKLKPPLNSNSKSEPHREKSFFEKASFFFSTVNDALKTVKIDTKVDEINESNYSIIAKAYKKSLFKKYPEYKEAKDEFDRLIDERIKKIDQMNALIFDLNKFRQYILDEYNPIVLELLDLLQEDESNIKVEYMNMIGKLHQKIDYRFKSTSSKDITKSETLLNWEDLKNNIETLEKDNKTLDNEIDKILNNEFFKNYTNNEFKDFNAIKSKLNSLIKQNKSKNIAKPKEEKKPTVQKDIELENLKKELKSLESKLQELFEQKTEYLNDIEEFNREYNLHLGELIKDILNLKKEILYKQTIKQQNQKVKYQEDIQTFQDTKETITELKSTIDELETALESIDEEDENYEELSQAYSELKEELEKLESELELQEEELEKTKEFIEDETIEQEYEEVNSHYEEFESEYEHIKESFENSITLNDEEKKELKSLYKKAARLCHPDIVPDELKEKAHELMQKLNEAYSKKDISKVKEILHTLKNGTSFEVSSETIEDKELLKSKIKEYKQNIEIIKSEIEEIKEDETYQTIAELDDWDEYFEEIKSELKNEKEKLEDKAIKNIETKVNNINNNDNEDIKYNSLNIELTSSDYLKSDYEKNIKEKLFSNAFLNPDLFLEHEQKNSYDSLAIKVLCNNTMIGYVLKYKNEENINNFCFENNKLKDLNLVYENDSLVVYSKNSVQSIKIKKETSSYTKHIQSMENIKFERIRKYCENLSKKDEADEMQKHLGEKGKMYKALMYSTLDVFIENLKGETITLCDWGCGQGIASMLVLDYIKEKQLDIKVSNVILIDEETKALSRAITQVEALAQDSIKFVPIKSDDNKIYDTIKSNKNNIVINLFANDKIPTNFWTIDYEIFDESYFLCVSNENKEFVDEIYENINSSLEVQDLSILDGKIGRFEKYERIFEVRDNMPLIDIDEDEIPF